MCVNCKLARFLSLSQSWVAIFFLAPYPSAGSRISSLEISSLDSCIWFDRSPTTALLGTDPKRRLFIRIKRYVSKATTTTVLIILQIFQNFLFVLFEQQASLQFTADTSIPEVALGGRLKLPPPLIDDWEGKLIDAVFSPAAIPTVVRCLFRRRSPCFNFGGRRACRELISCSYYFESLVVLSWTQPIISPNIK